MSSPASLRTAVRGVAAQSAPLRAGAGRRCTPLSGVLRSAATLVREVGRVASGRSAHSGVAPASDAPRSGATPRNTVQHGAGVGAAMGRHDPHCIAAASVGRRCSRMRRERQKTTAVSCVGLRSDVERRNRLQCMNRHVLLCIACIAVPSQLAGYAKSKWLRCKAPVVQAQHTSGMQAKRCMAQQAALVAL